MNKRFTVELCSDVAFEEMVADISYDDQKFAMITQENGINNMEITIYPALNDEKVWTFQTSDLLEVIQFAQERLRKFQKNKE